MTDQVITTPPETQYAVLFKYSTQTGIESWAHVSSILKVKPETTVAEIMAWSKSKRSTQEIAIELQEVESV